MAISASPVKFDDLLDRAFRPAPRRTKLRRSSEWSPFVLHTAVGGGRVLGSLASGFASTAIRNLARPSPRSRLRDLDTTGSHQRHHLVREANNL